MNRRLKSLILGVALSTGLSAGAAETSTSSVIVLKINGVINPVVGTYVEAGLARAKESGASAVLIELDTPGGLLDATRSAVSSIVNADLPVLLLVTPRGARATSAGVFFMMAADVAAMSPETHLGAAHPVTIGGESKPAREPEKKGEAKPEPMEEKMVSDAAAYIRALATEHGRNAAWAERAVRESVSLTAEEAVKENVIDLIAVDAADLFAKAHGRKLKKNGLEFTLSLKDAVRIDLPMTLAQRLLHLLGHPNVAYVLLTIGIYGLIYELAAPGIGLGGAGGAICLLLAFFSLQVVPLNVLGLSLLALGVVLMILELINPTHGALTLSGVASFVIGSFLLVDQVRGISFPRVSVSLILSSAAATTTFILFGVRKAWLARKQKPQTGAESLIGSQGETRSALAPEGTVFLQGELWTARSEGAAVAEGEPVRVVRLEGNILIVEKLT